MHKFNRLTLRLEAKTAQQEFRNFLAKEVLCRMKVMWVLVSLGLTLPTLYNFWLQTPGSKTQMAIIVNVNFIFIVAFLTRYCAKTDFFIHTFGISLVISTAIIIMLFANDMLFDEPSLMACKANPARKIIELWFTLVACAAFIVLSTDFL